MHFWRGTSRRALRQYRLSPVRDQPAAASGQSVPGQRLSIKQALTLTVPGINFKPPLTRLVCPQVSFYTAPTVRRPPTRIDALMSATQPYQYHGLILRVAVPSPLRQLFDYLPPNQADDSENPVAIGARVKVPFGRRQVVGVVMGTAEGSALPQARLRSASAILDDQPLFSPALYKMLTWAIGYYHHPPGEVMAAALPARLRQGEALRASGERWQINPDADPISANLARAPRQQQLYDWIARQGDVTREQLAAAEFNVSLLRQLESRQLLRRFRVTDTRMPAFDTSALLSEALPDLNSEQQPAVDQIRAGLESFACYLLDGVTGSGKTEVYMQVMAEVLGKGQQCLVLVPEIGLTPQTLTRFKQRFSCPVASLHSGLNDTERLEAWRQASDGGAGIVIGTRSAVFCELARPGLIVVDEEHDASFKQQDGFRYSARDLAVLRARESGIPVILGSATPSLESLLNAGRGRYQHLRLAQRAGLAQPAALKLVDIAEQPLEAGFADSVLQKMATQLEHGNQVLTFINRRGFAPMLHCLTCGWVAECEDCLTQLTVHSQPRALRCHHCGDRQGLPIACPGCASRELTTLGVGTQQIETQLQKRFVDYPVLRIDRDSTRSRKRLATMLDQVHSGKPCILIGTQMLAKGHHFPGITLVVVVDADAGLFSADFRGQEQMAQTIVQVAGRAGRAELGGEVLIQSRHASHATLQALTSLPYEEFAQQLLASRQDTGMPPYSHLALLRSEARSLAASLEFLAAAAQLIEQLAAQRSIAAECLGPVPAPMEKRAGRFRAQLSISSSDRAPLQKLLATVMPHLEQMKVPAGLRWSLDVDPQEMV